MATTHCNFRPRHLSYFDWSFYFGRALLPCEKVQKTYFPEHNYFAGWKACHPLSALYISKENVWALLEYFCLVCLFSVGPTSRLFYKSYTKYFLKTCLKYSPFQSNLHKTHKPCVRLRSYLKWRTLGMVWALFSVSSRIF